MNFIKSVDYKKLLLDKTVYDQFQLLDVKAKSEPDFCLLRDTICNQENICVQGAKCIVGPGVFHDIELFESYTILNKKTIFDEINKTFTKGGEMILRQLLSNPIYDVDTLKERKESLTYVLNNLDKIKGILETLQHRESDIMWVFTSNTDDFQQLYNMVYFTNIITKPLNRNPSLLTLYNFYRMVISPAIGILSPLAYIIIPYLVLRFKLATQISFFDYIRFLYNVLMNTNDMSGIFLPSSFSRVRYVSYLFTIIFYFQGMFNTVEIAKASHRLTKMITTKMNGFIEFIKNVSDLSNIVELNTLKPFFLNLQTFDKGIIDRIINTNTDKFSLTSNFGNQLSLFKYLNKSKFIPIIQFAYCVDCLTSIALLKSTGEYNFSAYICAVADAPLGSTIRPFVKFENIFHPCLGKDVRVTNTMTLGGMYNDAPNVIITGPNAGGKSTFIKALLVATIMAQTLTIAPTSEMAMIPFTLIHSHINVPDCKGKESLFEAEMYRSKYTLDQIQKLEKHDTGLIILDEIFNSTNPVEGIAGAYAIMNNIGSFGNVASVLATHYLYLTKLSSSGTFVNYKINVKHDQNTIIFPYKLSKGVSRQFIALELLLKNGFDNSIIKEALTIKNRLVQKPEKKSALETEITDCNNQLEK
jgi:hypothetical protein